MMISAAAGTSSDSVMLATTVTSKAGMAVDWPCGVTAKAKLRSSAVVMPPAVEGMITNSGSDASVISSDTTPLGYFTGSPGTTSSHAFCELGGGGDGRVGTKARQQTR